MTKFLLVSCTVLGLLVPSGFAATYKLPADKPVVSITLPDAWKPEVIERGIQGQSADGAIYLAAETTKTESGMNAIIDESLDMLKKQKVDLDKNSRKENKYKINDLDADEMIYTGKDADGPAVVKITFISIGTDTVLVLTYWASVDDELPHSKQIRGILQSIKALK